MITVSATNIHCADKTDDWRDNVKIKPKLLDPGDEAFTPIEDDWAECL